MIEKIMFKKVALVFVCAFVMQNCTPKIDPNTVEFAGAYKYAMGDCTAAYENYLGVQYKALFERIERESGYGGTPLASLRPRDGACLQTHLNEVVIKSAEFCIHEKYYVVADVYHNGYGWQTYPDGSSGPAADFEYKPVDSKHFAPAAASDCTAKGIRIKVRPGLNAVRIRFLKKPVVSIPLNTLPIEREKFESDSADHVAFITVASEEVLKKIGGGYNVREELSAKYEKEEAAAKIAAENTSDSAHRVWLNTVHLPSQTLTSAQLKQNEEAYTGQKFKNWQLRVHNESGGCVTFGVPAAGMLGENWGNFCDAADVAAFKKKYPNYRVGTQFTVKSGIIAGWVLGPRLKHLTF